MKCQIYCTAFQLTVNSSMSATCSTWLARSIQALHHRNADKGITVLSDCNWTRTHNHLVRKQTLNHLAKLTKQDKNIH